MKAISNRYEIIRKIGSGSKGDVFLARDLAEGQDVCLKMLSKTSVAGSKDLGREFTLLTRLRHRGLIRVLDFGVDDVHGSSLLRSNGTDQGTVVGLFRRNEVIIAY